VGARSAESTIDAATTRLTSLNINGQVQALEYANGNLIQRGARSIGFDIGHRVTGDGRPSRLRL